ncbi:MAG: AMP-binding protein, partial [Algicola sp.]|nr:AMP-binding protein [Algicola sp.]
LFDLENDLMLRSTFIRLSKDSGALLLNMHHIASDGWSMGLLVNEFWSEYGAIDAGQSSAFTPLPIQYADYAKWQRDWLAGEVLDAQLAYWEKQLFDLPQVHSLPLDRARPNTQTFNGDQLDICAGLNTLEGLKQLALNNNVTLFMLLQGAFSLLLSRHSNSDDIVMSVAVANRLKKVLEPIIGFFVNTLVLRTDCGSNPTFTEYLGKLKTTHLDAQANQDVPFELLVERLKPTRSTAHGPLFQIMFAMDNNQSSDSSLELNDLKLSALSTNEDQVTVAKFELTLNAFEAPDGLHFNFEYNSDLFDSATIQRLGTHLLCLLDGIVANPNQRIGLLPMLSADEQYELIQGLNNNPIEFPQHLSQHQSQRQSVHQWFEQQAMQTPDNIALEEGTQQLSYQALNEKADRLAGYLITQGVDADVMVGICIKRSIDLVIGLLAILKAGGAYLPIDPSYPKSRIDYMIKDSGIGLLLTQKDLIAPVNLTTVYVSEFDYSQAHSHSHQDHHQNDHQNNSPNNLAYVIYTSGSTGQPKGVLNEHGALMNLCQWHINDFNTDSNSRATHLC